jgi:hypothetical protein
VNFARCQDLWDKGDAWEGGEGCGSWRGDVDAEVEGEKEGWRERDLADFELGGCISVTSA